MTSCNLGTGVALEVAAPRAVAALQAVELAALDEVLGQVAAAAFASAQHERVQGHC